MSLLLEMFTYPFIVRAFVVGILVSLCAALLGVPLVLKRYSMIGDGLSHVSFGALSIAVACGWAPLPVSIPVVILAALGLLRLTERSRMGADAAIAVVSASSLAAGVIVTSLTTGMTTDVDSYMFGSILAMDRADVALSAGGNFDKFWKIFDERLALCHRALQARHKRLLGTPSDAAPILWQYGALARLKKGEKIDKLLFGGYSTISLGYAGLYECVKYMTGKSHTDAGAKPFALSVMQHMNDKCNEWKKAENMDYSLYGTPLESTTYKFAKCLQKRFGIVPGITDKNYITNSYHVHVSEHIDAFTKLKFESEFQKLSPGGAISYVEVPNMQDNLEAVMSVLQFIYDNIMYAELNTKSDYCQCCGYDGEIKIVEDDGKLVWECPKCGNRDQNKLNVARRTCGYIGTQFWNQGRTQEIKDRVLHL